MRSLLALMVLVDAMVMPMLIPIHIAVDATRRLAESGGPKPRTRTHQRGKRI